MAGIIAAHGRSDDNGVLGIAPAAKILASKGFQTRKQWKRNHIAAGIEWAASHGATVINISSATGPTLALDDAIALAAYKDIVVVAGSGNKAQTFALVIRQQCRACWLLALWTGPEN